MQRPVVVGAEKPVKIDIEDFVTGNHPPPQHIRIGAPADHDVGGSRRRYALEPPHPTGPLSSRHAIGFSTRLAYFDGLLVDQHVTRSHDTRPGTRIAVWYHRARTQCAPSSVTS